MRRWKCGEAAWRRRGGGAAAVRRGGGAAGGGAVRAVCSVSRSIFTHLHRGIEQIVIYFV